MWSAEPAHSFPRAVSSADAIRQGRFPHGLLFFLLRLLKN
jgi:hypothetical protein